MYVAPGFLERLLTVLGGFLFLGILAGLFYVPWGKLGKNSNPKLPHQPAATPLVDSETQTSPGLDDSEITGSLNSMRVVAEPTPPSNAGARVSNGIPAPFAVARTLFSTMSWALLLFSAALCAFSVWLAASISNYGSIADLQSQTNEVLFAVVVALASIAAGIAALFLLLFASTQD